jgi:hypothetical protein
MNTRIKRDSSNILAMILVKAKIRTLNYLVSKRVPEVIGLACVRVSSKVTLETLGVKFARLLLLVLENKNESTKDSVIVDCGLLLQILLVRYDWSQLCVDGAVQQVYGCMNCFCPELGRKAFGMDYIASHLHDSTIVTLNVAVLLWSIHSAQIMRHRVFLEMCLKLLVAEFRSLICTKLDHICTYVPLDLLHNPLEESESFTLLFSKVDESISSRIVLIENIVL